MKDADVACRSILKILGAVFAVSGLSFLLIPDRIIQLMNWTGRHVGTFQEAPTCDLKQWVCLTFAYMSLVTALAFLSARDPGGSSVLLQLLMLGKVSSSLSALGFYLGGRRCFIYLGTFWIDGSIVLLVGAIWLYYARRSPPVPGGALG